MAINTIKATIQMRRGLEQDFDPDQITAGEWAVSTDKKYVRMCFRPGLCLRMATYEAFEADMVQIQTILATCQDIQAAVDAMAALAEQHKDAAAASASASDGYAKLSKSYAVGTDGEVRENDASDNSKYYYEQSKRLVQGFNGIMPMGTITFAELADPLNQVPKYMFNISDEFTSDDRFTDGGGIYYGAGNNVVFTADGKWDALAASAVTGVKGAAETEYRQGNINITADDIGIVAATAAKAGIIKPDGETTAVDPDGTLHVIGNEGTIDYNELENKPAISGVTLEGDKSLKDLGGASVVELTKAEYDQKEANGELVEGTMYMIKDATPLDIQTVAAQNVIYDNTESGIEATNAQSAIDIFTEVIIPSYFHNHVIELPGTEATLYDDLLACWSGIPAGKGFIAISNQSTKYTAVYNKLTNGASVGSIDIMGLNGAKYVFHYDSTNGGSLRSTVVEVYKDSKNENIIEWDSGSAYTRMSATRHGNLCTLSILGSFSVTSGSTNGDRKIGVITDPLFIPANTMVGGSWLWKWKWSCRNMSNFYKFRRTNSYKC